MNYTLHQLQVFLKVTQTKSITKAAQELYLTQPAVSIQLKNFQDQFEIPLTEVIGRQLHVTDFGKEIAESVQNILNQIQAIDFKTLAHKGQLTGRLRIAVVSTGKYVMPYFLTDFMALHHGIDLVLDVTNKAQVLDSLIKNEVDFALVSVLPQKLNIEKTELMENRLYVIGKPSEKKRKAKQETASLEQMPIIFREEGSGTRYTMEQFLRANALQVRKKMELNTNEAVKQAVMAGLGCSIMPLIGIKNEIESGDLEIVPVKGFPIKSTWHLIWMKSKNHSPAASAYLEFVKMNKGHIISSKFGWLSSDQWTS